MDESSSSLIPYIMMEEEEEAADDDLFVFTEELTAAAVQMYMDDGARHRRPQAPPKVIRRRDRVGGDMGTGETATTKTTGGVLACEPPRAASSSSSHASKRRRPEAMADRFFPNDFPDFVAEVPDGVDRPAGLRGLLSLPYAKLSDRFLRAALRLKDKVVEETWAKAGRQVADYTLYTGALGTAMLLFKSFQVTRNRGDLTLAADIVRACNEASQGLP